MSWGAIGGAAIGAVGSYMSSRQNKKAAEAGQTTQQELDPRIASILFGSGDDKGILSQFRGMLGQPQTLGSGAIGNLSSNYLAGAAPDDITAIRNSALGLMAPRTAPNFNSPDFNNPNMVKAPTLNAPSQNGINLAPAYQNFIYGDSASDPRLTRALQSGINQSNQAFNTNIGNLTDTLQRNVLPGLRSNAVLAGQYGGSRQGIAEGLATSDFTKQAANAAQQLGLANISATTGAQANAYESGQNRALQALQGLSGQQYGAAQSNMEADLRSQLANQASGNQAALANQAARLDTNRLNAGNILQTNAQNNAGAIAGSGALSGLLGQMYGYNQNAQNADLMRAQGVSNLLSPYIGANSSQTSTQPYYSNTAGNVLGGAAAGLGLYNQFKGLFGGGGGSGLPSMAGATQYNWGPY